MYMIIGVQRDKRQCLLATPTSAREALHQFRIGQKQFPTVLVQFQGETLGEAELVSRANAETSVESD